MYKQYDFRFETHYLELRLKTEPENWTQAKVLNKREPIANLNLFPDCTIVGQLNSFNT